VDLDEVPQRLLGARRRLQRRLGAERELSDLQWALLRDVATAAAGGAADAALDGGAFAPDDPPAARAKAFASTAQSVFVRIAESHAETERLRTDLATERARAAEARGAAESESAASRRAASEAQRRLLAAERQLAALKPRLGVLVAERQETAKTAAGLVGSVKAFQKMLAGEERFRLKGAVCQASEDGRAPRGPEASGLALGRDLARQRLRGRLEE
jgi:hypothetical protein